MPWRRGGRDACWNGEPGAVAPPPAGPIDRWAKALARCADALHRAGGLVLLPLLVLVVCYDIFMRYVLVDPSLWANEISTVLLAPVFFLSLAQVTLRGEHLRTDILYNRFGPGLRRIADLVAGTLGMVFLLSLLVEMFNGMMEGIRYAEGTQNIGFPFWPVHAAIIVSLALAIVMFATRVVYAVRGRVRILDATSTSDEV